MRHGLSCCPPAMPDDRQRCVIQTNKGMHQHALVSFATFTNERALSSSEAYLQFDLCRQPQEPSLPALSSQAEMLLVEPVVQEDQQKNWADIDGPNPREYHRCRCISRPLSFA